MTERLWSMQRDGSTAEANLEDFGTNGFEVRIRVTDEPPRVDRFSRREDALDHAAKEMELLRAKGWSAGG
jgi:hypothetical protein